MNTASETIRRVMLYEVSRRQEAYEMLMDGYDGDLEEYITDYAEDYEVEEVTTDTYRVTNINGRSWVVEDGEVERVVF